jgi:mannose-6-phosphate isomerase-like protein (cupin superfamily)
MQEKKWETEQYKMTKYDEAVEVGKLKALKNGWVFGSFREIESLARTENFELKYWEFKKGDAPHHEPKFQILATEYNFIIEGRIKGRIGDIKDIELGMGDYVVIRPGEIVNLQEEIIEDVKGITIKVPSRHGDTIKKSLIENLLSFHCT